MFLTDQEIPMFVKGGSILPLLILPTVKEEGKKGKPNYSGVKSLLEVYPQMEVTLQLFMDAGDMAEGLLYWDDGLTFNHSQESQKALVLFRLDEHGLLTVTRMIDPSRAQYEREVKLKQVEVYGYRSSSSEQPVVTDMTRYMGKEKHQVEAITVEKWEGDG